MMLQSRDFLEFVSVRAVVQKFIDLHLQEKERYDISRDSLDATSSQYTLAAFVSCFVLMESEQMAAAGRRL